MPRCGGGAPHCKGLKRNCCSAFGRDSSAASCWGSGFTEDRCCTPENAECFPAGSSLRYSDCCPNADCIVSDAELYQVQFLLEMMHKYSDTC